MFNFSFGGDVDTYLLEITLGNTVVERNQMSTVGIMAQQQYLNICESIGQDSRPMKCTISKQEIMPSSKMFTYVVDFANNSYINEFGGLK